MVLMSILMHSWPCLHAWLFRTECPVCLCTVVLATVPMSVSLCLAVLPHCGSLVTQQPILRPCSSPSSLCSW